MTEADHQGIYQLGKYIGPGHPTHGTASTYRSRRYACRCTPCCEANTALVMQERLDRTARLEADPSLAVHGSASTYRNWGCRCVPCSQAHAQVCKDYQARVKARA